LKTSIIEGAFVETVEGLIFDVKGLVHPPDRVIAFVRYYLNERGNRLRSDGRRYSKLYDLKERYDFLRSNYPAYVYFDYVFGMELQAVPHDRINIVYEPRQQLRKLLSKRAGSQEIGKLKEYAIDLAKIISKEANIPISSIGISGSILVGLETEDSDLDLVIYGEKECRKAYEALHQLLESEKDLRRYTLTELKDLYEFKKQAMNVSFEDFLLMESRKVSQGVFKGVDFFVRFVKEPSEINETYGDRIYRKVGRITVKAKVIDASDSIFTPCRYLVKVLSVLDGAGLDAIKEVVSFRGRFTELANDNDIIIVRGDVERVTDVKNKTSYYRIILGNSRDDFLIRR